MAFNSAGVALRAPHLEDIINTKPAVPWYEAVTENFLNLNSPATKQLLKICEEKSIVLHGVGMNLGGSSDICSYLQRLKMLIRQVRPALISDHLCWTGIDGFNSHDLLPLPYNDDSFLHIKNRIDSVQTELGHKIAIENITRYLDHEHLRSEVDFINKLCAETGCQWVLDISNVLINCKNHDLNADEYFTNIDYNNIVQVHLALGQNDGFMTIDNHCGAPGAEDIKWFKTVLMKTNSNLPALVEWDRELPQWEVLFNEKVKLDKVYDTFAVSKSVSV